MTYARLVSALRVATLALPLFGLVTALELGCGVTDSNDVGSNSGATTNHHPYAYGGGDYGYDDDGYASDGYGDYGYP